MEYVKLKSHLEDDLEKAKHFFISLSAESTANHITLQVTPQRSFQTEKGRNPFVKSLQVQREFL